MIVLHRLLCGCKLYLQVLDLSLVLFLHLVDELLFLAHTLKLFFCSSALGADLEEMCSTTVGCYKEEIGVRYCLSDLDNSK